MFLNKGTSLAGWWLMLTDLDELADYLQATGGRYGRAFQNHLRDSEYRDGVVGHGPFPTEAPLTLAAHYRGVNRRESIIQSLAGLAGETAMAMADRLCRTGHVYVNPNGGWNDLAIRHDPGDVFHSKKLAWPEFTEADIRISRFPGGRHWYARVGTVDVRNGDTLRFDTREQARTAARKLLAQE